MSASDLTNSPLPPHLPPIRAKLREALKIIAIEGASQREAAERAGMSEHGVQRALAKPHVRAYLDGVKRAWKEGRTSKAWANVADLADNAASEDVRLKANRTFLESMGELSPNGNGSDQAPRQLIQIITDRVDISRPPLERWPGVTEAPPLDGVGRAPRAELLR